MMALVIMTVAAVVAAVVAAIMVAMLYGEESLQRLPGRKYIY